MESIEERDVAAPIIKQAITSAPSEADVTVSRECLPSRGLIGQAEEEAHEGSRAISDICYPPQGRSTAMESVEERDVAVPIIKQAITSAPSEAGVTVSHECLPSRGPIGKAEPREELLAIAPASEPEIVEDGMELESASVSIINPSQCL
jgi:hypothetical protein